MLPRLRILQVGDIHLISSARNRTILDDKDKSFPSRLRAEINSFPLKAVFRAIDAKLDSGAVDAIALMGDFTDYGNLNGFQACCQYLAKALKLGKTQKNDALPTAIVPGNHDIDRALASSPGSNTKFTPLLEALANYGLSAIPVDRPLFIDVARDSMSATLCLVNSCWGCGEKQFIPSRFREPIEQAIASVISNAKDGSAIKDYYNHQLDTPAITHETIEAVVKRIQSDPAEKTAVVIAHHNLLPQRQVRLAPYTELVNGGAIRASLEDLKRPIIYLHGHIHQETVEIIRTPLSPPLVSISAPLITEGFNVIEILHTLSGFPLACHIRPYRFDGSGVFRETQPVAVRLGGSGSRSIGADAANLFAKLIPKRQLYWTEIVALAKKLKGDVTDDQIVETLEILFAEEMIVIENHTMSRSHWLVRVTI